MTLSGCVLDARSSALRMSCAPWQVVQLGALASPLAKATAWAPWVKSDTGFVWQLAVQEAAARSCLCGSLTASPWQSTQARPACTLALSDSAVTCSPGRAGCVDGRDAGATIAIRSLGGIVARRLWPWHWRQRRFCISLGVTSTASTRAPLLPSQIALSTAANTDRRTLD